MRFLPTAGLLCLLASTASADWPIWAHHVNQFHRVLGVGWSDGYHSCRYESRPVGSNLPPTPYWLKQRWSNADALHGIADPQYVSTPTAAELRDVDAAVPEVQQPASPSHPPVPPSILEEIREHESSKEHRDAVEQLGRVEQLGEQTDYQNFLKAVTNESGRFTY